MDRGKTTGRDTGRTPNQGRDQNDAPISQRIPKVVVSHLEPRERH